MDSAATLLAPDPVTPSDPHACPGVFVLCPHCGLKLFVTPSTIPENGREKRCVRCLDRFRLVLSLDDVVVQFGHEETRYPLNRDGRDPRGRLAENAGLFDELVKAGGHESPEVEDAPPDEGPPIEQRIQIDQVVVMLGKDAPGSRREQGPTRILATADVQARAVAAPPRAFRLAQQAAPVPPTRRERVLAFFAQMVPLDYALLVSLAIVTAGTLLGFTGAGFFGGKALGWSAEAVPDLGVAPARGTFTADEIARLVDGSAAPARRATSKAFRGTGAVLPDGNYEELFVEDVEVVVRSVPAGATVHLGPKALGQTPLLLRLAGSQEVIELQVEQEGYAPETLRFAPDQARLFNLALRALRDDAPQRARPSTPPRLTRRPAAPASPGPGPTAAPTPDPTDFLVY